MVVFLYLIPGDAKHLFMCLSICIYPSQYLFNLLVLSSLPILTKMEQALTEVGGGGGSNSSEKKEREAGTRSSALSPYGESTDKTLRLRCRKKARNSILEPK